MSDLPGGWARTTLGQLGRYTNGRAFKSDEWGDLGRPIIRIQNLTGTSKEFNFFHGHVETRHVVKPGDLLVSWSATLGAYLWDGPEAVLNQHIFRVESYVNKRFHKYLLDHVLAELKAKTHGSGMVHITRKPFNDTPVMLPPLAEQDRIVAAIEEQASRIDAGVAAIKRVRPLLARLRGTTLQMTLTGRRVINCDVVRFGELLREPLRNGHSAKRDDSGTIPILSLSSVTEGDFSARNIKMTAADPKRVSDLWIQSGDLLIERSNTRELVGTARLYTGPSHIAVFPDLIIRARVSNTILPRFAEFVLQAPASRRFLQQRAQGISGSMPKIDQAAIEALPLRLPPVSIQTEMVAEVEQVWSVIGMLDRATKDAELRASGLRSAILRAAFSGRLVPQDASDEPAEVLLHRISAVTPLASHRTRRSPRHAMSRGVA